MQINIFCYFIANLFVCFGVKVRRQAVPGPEGPRGTAVRRMGSDFGGHRRYRAHRGKAGLRKQGVSLLRCAYSITFDLQPLLLMAGRAPALMLK